MEEENATDETERVPFGVVQMKIIQRTLRGDASALVHDISIRGISLDRGRRTRHFAASRQSV